MNLQKMVMKKIILVGVLALLLFVTACNPTGDVVIEDNYDDFAKFLTEEGVVLVGAEWCSHCQNQKATFGDSFEYITFIDAVYEPELAASYGVPGYPTWVLADGTQLVGEQSIEKLMEATGYNA